MAADIEIAVGPEGHTGGRAEPAAVGRHERIDELSVCAVVAPNARVPEGSHVKVAIRTKYDLVSIRETTITIGDKRIHECAGEAIVADDRVIVMAAQEDVALLRASHLRQQECDND